MDTHCTSITLRSETHYLTLMTKLWEQVITRQGVDGHRGMSVKTLMARVFLNNDKMIKGCEEKLPVRRTLQSMIMFMYSGRCTVTLDEMADILSTAREWEFHLLVETIVNSSYYDSLLKHRSPAQQPPFVPTIVTRRSVATANSGQGQPAVSPVPLPLVSCRHRDYVVKGLHGLCLRGEGSDCHIGLGVWAHRCILDIFLSTAKLTRCSVTATSSRILRSLLEFLYTGMVEVNKDILAEMLAIARGCDFKLLVDSIAAVQPPVQQSLPMAYSLESYCGLEPTMENSEQRQPGAWSDVHASGHHVSDISSVPDTFSVLEERHSEQDIPDDAFLQYLLSLAENVDDQQSFPLQAMSEGADTEELLSSLNFNALASGCIDSSQMSAGSAEPTTVDGSGYERPFKCEECELCFETFENLLQHSLIHAEDRNNLRWSEKAFEK